MRKITGTVKSEQGFYIGDLCYALNHSIYYEVWGGAHYKDGIYEDPTSGFSFAVAGTAYGDGTYNDDHLREYGVDAGNISLVPAELAENTDGGHFFPGAGEATFEAEDGVFAITLPDGQTICINTEEYAEEEEEEEDDDDEEYDEDFEEDEEY